MIMFYLYHLNLLQTWDKVVQLSGQPSRYRGQGDSNPSLGLGWLPIREWLLSWAVTQEREWSWQRARKRHWDGSCSEGRGWRSGHAREGRGSHKGSWVFLGPKYNIFCFVKSGFPVKKEKRSAFFSLRVTSTPTQNSNKSFAKIICSHYVRIILFFIPFHSIPL